MKSEGSVMKCPNTADNCRACRNPTQKESKIDIFTQVLLSDIYKETTSLDIHENDRLPKELCYKCLNRLLEAYNFRKMCCESALYFQSILSADVNQEKDAHQEKPEQQSDVASATAEDLSNTNDKDDFSIEISDEESTDENHEEVRETGSEDETPLILRKSKSKNHIGLKDPAKGHLGLEPYECKTCGKELGTPIDLMFHSQTHEADTPPTGSQSPMPLQLNQEDQESNKRNTNEEDMWFCKYCTYKSSYRSNLKRHKIGVHGRKDHNCFYCKKSFSNANSLKLHIKTHSTERPYECSKCVKRFPQKSPLNRHMKIHTRKGIFQGIQYL